MIHKRENDEQKIENKILNTIKNYNLIKKGDKIVVGVSGGPDSICLIDNLNKMKKSSYLNMKMMGKSSLNESCDSEDNFEIVVAHVNHMIRNEALADEEYVKSFCEKNGIEFYAKSIDVQKLAHTNKIGVEEAGRFARYDFFHEVLENTKATKIAVAHNKNDKVETVLMHMLRGSGIDGLKGMEAKRGNIIRPLIECERTEIEKYCEDKLLQPRIDKTNFENIYNRNKIRNVVIPYIQKEFNPNIVQTMDRLSNIVALEDEYMEKQTQKAYQELIIDKGQNKIVMDLKGFNLHEKVIKSRLIRYIIKELYGNVACIEKIHIDDIIKLCNNSIGNKYLMPNKNVKILVKNRKIYFMKLKSISSCKVINQT